MSVVFIQEITGRDGTKDVDTNKRYRRTWIVRTSSTTDGASVVLAAPGIPSFNSPYQYVGEDGTVQDPSAVCVEVRVSQDNANDPLDWRVIADYVGIDDPTAQPADVDYSPTRYQKALVTDLDGRAVVNTAGDPFESGMTVDRTRFTLTIVKPVLFWDAAAADEFNDSVNLDTFIPSVGTTGFPAGTCKLVWGAKRVKRAGNNSFYWLRTSVIDINKEGWTVRLRNAGFKQLVYNVPDPVPGVTVPIDSRLIMVGKGEYATSPQLLDAAGRWIGPIKPGAAVPAPLAFKGYYLKSWATLNLQY